MQMHRGAAVSFAAVFGVWFLAVTAAFAAPPAKPVRDFGEWARSAHACAEGVGVKIVSLPSGRVVWEHHADTPLIPASLAKLFTGYTALKRLGPDHRFRTELLTEALPQGGTVAGNLWIRSEGDILLTTERAAEIANLLKAASVKTVSGGLRVDNSRFLPGKEQICLDGKCIETYNPVISATAMDYNVVTLRIEPGSKPKTPAKVLCSPPGDYLRIINKAETGPRRSRSTLEVVPGVIGESQGEVARISGKIPAGGPPEEFRFNAEAPALFTAHAFKEIFRRKGIDILGPAGEGTAPSGAVRTTLYESPPLGELLYGLNRYSNNFMAEMLLRSLGGATAGYPGTSLKGLDAVKKSVRELGIPEQEAVTASGSGLDRISRVSPAAFCTLLFSAWGDPVLGPVFFASMAENGCSGTLCRRLIRPGLVVRGKTGTLSDVVGFAGVVSPASGGQYIVAVMLNGVKDVSAARAILDALLETDFAGIQ